MTKALLRALDALKRGQSLTLASVPDGFDALVVADLARALKGSAEGPAVLLHVARDGQRQQVLQNALAVRRARDRGSVLPGLGLPALRPHLAERRRHGPAHDRRWRGSPARAPRRSGRASCPPPSTPPSSACRPAPAWRPRVSPPRRATRSTPTSSSLWLETNGFLRSGTVRDTGEYAVRGGIIDLFPPGYPNPIRLDFFGDTLESIRSFDPETQRSIATLRALDLVPLSEAPLTTETIRRFRQGYVAAFGAPTRDDRLYEAVSEGRRYPGLEHWLPLLHERLDTLFDYLPGVPVVFDALADDAAGERLAQVKDYYDARKSQGGEGQGVSPYRPLPPDALYMAPDEWAKRVEDLAVARLSPFATPEGGAKLVVDLEARRGRNFVAERADENANLFEAAVQHIRDLQAKGRRVVVGAWSEGSRERLSHVLGDHGLDRTRTAGRLAEALGGPRDDVPVVVWGLEAGFEAGDLAVVSEQDILGDRLVRAKRKSKRPQDFLTEVAALTPGDLVVHVDHGIGRFEGLKTIEAAGAPHDCLELHYAGGDRLFLPVENIELLTRYGSEEAEVALDRLGGGAWQARKARMKQRIREMAGALMKIAAARLLKEAPRLTPPDGLYDEFCARFPYEETEDQQNAIDATLGDLGSGRPMDRLICGDVGFGKTEVALRAAFTTAMAGKQVAVVVPTTLLARQHYANFCERFRGLPLNVAQASRFVPAAEMKKVKDGPRRRHGRHRGRHPCPARQGDPFKDLGLIIVDEEQHFGVSHKERLKELRAEVHVLTLTATPIPRTLQLALTGVRELSLIATPPVDRLAVRTFVTPFDPLIVREALLRERYRGGQAFYVVPRIEDIAEVKTFLDRQLPESKVAVAHGQMAAGQLEDVMTAFYEGHYDVLLSTTIVESRPRHPDRQHADRAPGRHVRPVAALPAPRPRRPLEDARLRAVHRAGEPHADRPGRAPPQGAAIARHARGRLPARLPRPRHPRRRQPARARSSPGTSRRSATSSTSRCWRRRWRSSRRASRSRPRTSGRRPSPSARR